MQTEESLSALSYRELQAIAKTHGIPANKKKDDIIQMILATNTSQESTAAVDEEAGDASEVVSSPTVTNEITEKEPSTVDVLTEVFSSVMKLNGVATPQGKKTVFSATETPKVVPTYITKFQSPKSAKKTPAQQFQTPIYDAENATPQQMNAAYYTEDDDCEDEFDRYTVKSNKKQETKSNSHKVFMSPEVALGQKVHWRYEQYDLEAQTQVPAAPPSTAQKVSLKSATNTPKKQNATVLFAAQNETEREQKVINFWLSKGNTPKKVAH